MVPCVSNKYAVVSGVGVRLMVRLVSIGKGGLGLEVRV